MCCYFLVVLEFIAKLQGWVASTCDIFVSLESSLLSPFLFANPSVFEPILPFLSPSPYTRVFNNCDGVVPPL